MSDSNTSGPDDLTVVFLTLASDRVFSQNEAAKILSKKIFEMDTERKELQRQINALQHKLEALDDDNIDLWEIQRRRRV